MTDPNADMDGDGWTPAQGDCNDCDPTVNPGAVDVPGDPASVDHDCDGTYDPPAPCDTGLALDDVSALDGAKAIELCQTTTATARNWGVISAAYVRADGTAFATPGVQVGLQPSFGDNVHTQAGTALLALSSGHARTTLQADACGSASCAENMTATAPPGYPQPITGCMPTTTIQDDVALEVALRTPTNATGYSFAFRFYSMEFPYWVCQPYEDQFIALVSPPPVGALMGNVAIDGMSNPVSTSFQFFDVCDPTQITDYAAACATMGTTCPTAPSPYCPNGTTDLLGTGFDVWDSSYGNGGATVWLTTQAPVQGGSQVTIRFAIWDGGDSNFDSTSLIDNFQWITSGPVAVGTTPIVNPK